MPAPISDLNIQENLKTCIKKPAALGGNLHTATEEQIEALAALLGSTTFTGKVLRVLVRRLRHPERDYTNNELEVLLALTIALERNGMWREWR